MPGVLHPTQDEPMQAWIPLDELIRFLSWLVGLDHFDNAGGATASAAFLRRRTATGRAGRDRADAFPHGERHA